MSKASLFAVVFVFALAFTGRASDITYDVDLTVGAGSVSGFIETDGTTTGPLSDSDIVSWNLLLNNSVTTFDLTPSNSAIDIEGSDVTATATQLFFNFGASDNGNFIIEYPYVGSDATFVCFESSLDCTYTPAGISLAIGNHLPEGAQQITAYSTNAVIGTAVPEPSSVMVLSALLAAALVARRQIARG
jgi:hypothetical protein